MAVKRDYYEVLGVSKVQMKMRLRRHTENLRRNIIRIQIQAMRMLKKNLKKLQRHILF